MFYVRILIPYKMKRTIFLLPLACLNLNARPQSFRYPLANPYMGLTSYSKIHADISSFTGNPAALSGIEKPGIAVYGERRFMLQALSSYSVVGAIPSRMGNIGLQLNYSGYKNFNENMFMLTYGRTLGPKAAVGIRFNYYSQRVPVYGNLSTLTVEAGAIFHFNEQLHGGIHIYNPVGGRMGKNGNEKLASVYSFGLGLDASESFYIGAVISKEEDKPVEVSGGFQYRFAHRFFARGGILSATTMAWAGAGIETGGLRLDFTGSFHPQLGISPGFLLQYTFQRGKTLAIQSR